MSVTLRPRVSFLPIFLLFMFAKLPLATTENNQLEVMNEQELRQLIADEDYVVVLFSKCYMLDCPQTFNKFWQYKK